MDVINYHFENELPHDVIDSSLQMTTPQIHFKIAVNNLSTARPLPVISFLQDESLCL